MRRAATTPDGGPGVCYTRTMNSLHFTLAQQGDLAADHSAIYAGAIAVLLVLTVCWAAVRRAEQRRELRRIGKAVKR